MRGTGVRADGALARAAQTAGVDPAEIREGIEREEADKLKSELEEAGASVELK